MKLEITRNHWKMLSIWTHIRLTSTDFGAACWCLASKQQISNGVSDQVPTHRQDPLCLQADRIPGSNNSSWFFNKRNAFDKYFNLGHFRKFQGFHHGSPLLAMLHHVSPSKVLQFAVRRKQKPTKTRQERLFWDSPQAPHSCDLSPKPGGSGGTWCCMVLTFSMKIHESPVSDPNWHGNISEISAKRKTLLVSPLSSRV